MAIAKKVGLDILIIALLSVLTVFVAGAISMAAPDCVTCGANIAGTFWFASVLALQPVVWATNIAFMSRLLAWVSALIAGAAVYLVLEGVAGFLLTRGSATIALRLGYWANTAGVLACLFVSYWLVRIKQRGARSSANAGAVVEP
jgi:hypothetical protein